MKTNKTYRNPRKVQEKLSGKYNMIQKEGERGQETEKNTHTQIFHAFFFSTVSVKLKKKSCSLSNSLFYKEKRGLMVFHLSRSDYKCRLIDRNFSQFYFFPGFGSNIKKLPAVE